MSALGTVQRRLAFGMVECMVPKEFDDGVEEKVDLFNQELPEDQRQQSAEDHS